MVLNLMYITPANGDQLAICAEATQADVDKAVAAATEAFKTWKTVSQVDRADYLLKIADAIDAHKEHLAQVETYDNGKPIRETLNVDIPHWCRPFPLLRWRTSRRRRFGTSI